MTQKKKIIITVILGIIFGLGLIVLVINMTRTGTSTDDTKAKQSAEKIIAFGEEESGTDGAEADDGSDESSSSSTNVSQDEGEPTDYETSPDTIVDADTPREDFSLAIEGMPDDVVESFPTSIENFKTTTENTFYQQKWIYYSKMTYLRMETDEATGRDVYIFYMDDVPECLLYTTYVESKDMYLYYMDYE